MSACIQIGRKNSHSESSPGFTGFGGGKSNVKLNNLQIGLRKMRIRLLDSFRAAFFGMVVRINGCAGPLQPFLRPLDAPGNLAQGFLNKGFQVHHFIPSLSGLNGHGGAEMSRGRLNHGQ